MAATIRKAIRSTPTRRSRFGPTPSRRPAGTEFDKVVDALMKTDKDSVVGKLRFDDKGDIKDASYVWYKWSNGNYAEDKSM